MTIAVLTTLTLVAGLIIFAAARADRWRRTPIELRGNWWGRFERQFQTYASAQQGPIRTNRSRS